jgi:hypothetical protein
MRSGPACRSGRGGDTEARWRDRLRNVPLNALAVMDGTSVGMVGGALVEPNGAELLSMWVQPDARGVGVGDFLVQAVVGWARRQRATHLELNVREANGAATRLYERHGCVDIGPSPLVRNGPRAADETRPGPARAAVSHSGVDLLSSGGAGLKAERAAATVLVFDGRIQGVPERPPHIFGSQANPCRPTPVNGHESCGVTQYGR